MSLQSTAKMLVSFQQAIVPANKVSSTNPVLYGSIKTNVKFAQLERAVDALSQGASGLMEPIRKYIDRFKNSDKVKTLAKAEELEKEQDALYDTLREKAKEAKKLYEETLKQIDKSVDPEQTTKSGITHQQLEKIRNLVDPLVTASNHTIEKGIGTLSEIRMDINLSPIPIPKQELVKPIQVSGEAPVLRK